MSKSRVTKPATIPPWADDYAGCPKCKRLKSETPRTELTRLLTAAKQAEPILQHVRRQFDSALSCDSRSDDSTRAARIVLIELLNAIKQCDVAAMPNIKAEPPPTRGVNRDSGTDSANGGRLRRLVGQAGLKIDENKDCKPNRLGLVYGYENEQKQLRESGELL